MRQKSETTKTTSEQVADAGHRQAVAYCKPHVTHVHTTKHLIGQVRQFHTISEATSYERAIVKRFAIDERSIDIPGNSQKGHATGRPASRR